MSAIFLAPAVTPWETTLPDVMGGAGNNPAIRLIQYDRMTGVVLDVHQYYLNLTKANAISDDIWELEYNATQYFGVADMSAVSLNDIAQRMKTDDALFGRYYKANGVLYDPNEQWTEEMRTIHYCAAVHVDYEDYRICVNPPDDDDGDTSAASSMARGLPWICISIFVFLYIHWIIFVISKESYQIVSQENPSIPCKTPSIISMYVQHVQLNKRLLCHYCKSQFRHHLFIL